MAADGKWFRLALSILVCTIVLIVCFMCLQAWKINNPPAAPKPAEHFECSGGSAGCGGCSAGCGSGACGPQPWLALGLRDPAAVYAPPLVAHGATEYSPACGRGCALRGRCRGLSGGEMPEIESTVGFGNGECCGSFGIPP